MASSPDHVIDGEHREFLVELFEEVRECQKGMYHIVLDEGDIDKALEILGEEP